MILKNIFFILVLSFVTAKAATQLGVGPHTPLFICEKSRHPENIMVIYTVLDKNCHVERNGANNNKPIFDFYWLMDREKFKPVHALIKREIRKRLEVLPADDAQSFKVVMNDLKEVNTDIKNINLSVKTELQNGKCMANSFLTLGESDKNAVIRLKSIYAESKGAFFPTLVAITLNGEDAKTGKQISRKYLAK